MRNESQDQLLSSPQHCASAGGEVSISQTVPGNRGKCRNEREGEKQKKKGKKKKTKRAKWLYHLFSVT